MTVGSRWMLALWRVTLIVTINQVFHDVVKPVIMSVTVTVILQVHSSPLAVQHKSPLASSQFSSNYLYKNYSATYLSLLSPFWGQGTVYHFLITILNLYSFEFHLILLKLGMN